jgi:hypothetical protein
MGDIAGLGYLRLEFDKSGKVLGGSPPAWPKGISDLIVVSHGWHMNAAASQTLYEQLIGNLVKVAGNAWQAAGRQVGVAGIFWPADKFRDDLGMVTVPVTGGTAASVGGELGDDALKAQARDMAGLFGIQDLELETMALLAKGGGGDADRLAERLRQAVAGPVDEQTRRDHDELMTLPGREILDFLKVQKMPEPLTGLPVSGGSAAAMGSAGAASQASGQALGFFSGAAAGVAKLLNQFAYFELKKRAGLVGNSLGALLDSDDGLEGVMLHLVGHSFGARLVTSAVKAMTARKAESLTLLQGAFSHNAFAASIKYDLIGSIVGSFRDVIGSKKVNGPIAITHTWNDWAVGVAYPTASRVSADVASAFVTDAFGGTRDPFGGMGSNGARGMASSEGADLVYDGNSQLALQRGFVHNVLCNFIADHNDVSRIEVARVVRAALG